MDPRLCRADELVGQVLGHRGKLPAIYSELEIQHFLLRRLLGVKSDSEKSIKVCRFLNSCVSPFLADFQAGEERNLDG